MPNRAHQFFYRFASKQKTTFLNTEQITRLMKIESESIDEQTRKREREKFMAEERKKVVKEVNGKGEAEDAPKLFRLCRGDVPSTSQEKCSCSNRRRSKNNPS